MRGTIAEAARWQSVKERYPEAGRAFVDGRWHGSLRHSDPMTRATSLGRLIDALLEREQAKGPVAPCGGYNGAPDSAA